MKRSTPDLHALVAALAVTATLAWPGQAVAQGSAVQVYRCPGPPVLYTDALSATEARERGCTALEGQPITVIQGPRAKPAAGNASAASSAAPPQRPGEGRVDAQAQRQRDVEARRILESELRREEDRLASLRREYNNGEPERQGDERNYQRYLDRVASLKASIARTESDIAAIKRELAKLPT